MPNTYYLSRKIQNLYRMKFIKLIQAQELSLKSSETDRKHTYMLSFLLVCCGGDGGRGRKGLKSFPNQHIRLLSIHTNKMATHDK